MNVTSNRPLVARPIARPTATAKAPQVTVKAQAPIKPQALGPRAKLGVWTGAVGGALAGGIGIGLPVALFNLLTKCALLSPVGMITFALGAAAVGAAGGALWGALTGTVEDKVLGKVAKNPATQWGIYVSGYGVFHAVGSFVKGQATGANASGLGLGSLLAGIWQTSVEFKGLKEGGRLVDNRVRLGGAALATAGGAAALAALFPAVAAAVPFIAPVGVGMMALGWAANLVGQFMNENR